LRDQWRQLLAKLPMTATLAHPLTGREERITLDRGLLLGAVRAPLYAPALAAGLPAALAEAAQGHFGPLLALGRAMGATTGTLATGMHFSVVCAEDAPRLEQSLEVPGPDFGTHQAQLYRRICADWPAGRPPAEFYGLVPAQRATLVLSGGVDPATPPRHGERVVQALGAQARHVTVAEAGHGVLALGCMRDVVLRFIDAATDNEALKVDASCVAAIPRPPAFVPLSSAPASRP